MIRLAVSPALIAAGMALIVHFLALAWSDWASCGTAVDKPISPYMDYTVSLLSNWGLAIPTVVVPFLPFIITAMFLRAPERLYWQWAGIGITIAVLVFVLSNLGTGQVCDPDAPSEYGIPELAPIIIGLFVGFPICLLVTYIGSVRSARRAAR
jgi:Na+(H+)/acetate symporter ActP